MEKFLLYAHGGSYNHGAEAILKMTISIIRSKYKNSYIVVSTHFPEQDREFGIDADKLISPDYEIWEQEKKAESLEDKTKFARQMYAEALSEIAPDVTLISIGGDNYCYKNWHRLAIFQEEAVNHNAKSILWGASIEPSEMTEKMIDVLSTYTHVLVRESITYHELLKRDIRTNVDLIPDVAFTLPTSIIQLPFVNPTVGINISPLVVRKEKTKGIIHENINKLIDYIVFEKSMDVVLIPHVVNKADNDYEELRNIYLSLSSDVKTRVHLADETLSSEGYKFIISNCKALICSRTHASIAAYSTAVPVLVIGYSIKSIGIATDLGIPETVINIDSIYSPDTLTNKFQEVNLDKYKLHLLNLKPQYIDKIDNYCKYI